MEQKPIFSPSEIVRLKGQPDSPNMTVRGILKSHFPKFNYSDKDKYLVRCDFWDKKKQRFITNDFEEIQLEKAPENE